MTLGGEYKELCQAFRDRQGKGDPWHLWHIFCNCKACARTAWAQDTKCPVCHTIVTGLSLDTVELTGDNRGREGDSDGMDRTGRQATASPVEKEIRQSRLPRLASRT